MEFKCTSCGACCIMAGKLGLMPSKIDGSCIHLNNNNQCDIYEIRPEVCNVKRMYKKRVKNGLKMSYKEYCIVSSKLCNTMIDSLGIDKKYKINLGEYNNA